MKYRVVYTTLENSHEVRPESEIEMAIFNELETAIFFARKYSEERSGVYRVYENGYVWNYRDGQRI